MTVRLTAGALIVAATIALAAQTSVPSSSLSADAHLALEKRCGTPKSVSPESIAALRHARWVPFLHLDQAIARNGIEVIGGMTAATPGCAPERFNLFVFADGKFAGTLASAAMTPSRDGAAGAVRVTGADTITVEFARYLPSDPSVVPRLVNE